MMVDRSNYIINEPSPGLNNWPVYSPPTPTPALFDKKGKPVICSPDIYPKLVARTATLTSLFYLSRNIQDVLQFINTS